MAEDDSDPDCPPAKQLSHEHEWELFQLLEQVPVGIFVVNAEGKPYYANHRARRLLHIGSVPEHVGQFSAAFGAYEIGTSQLYPTERLPIVRALAGESCEISDLELRRDGAAPIPLHISGAPMNLHGKLAFAVSALQDIRELRRIVASDALTGLPNRAAVADAFVRERLLADRSGAPLALALIDFDRFKTINDTYGHAKGDEVLRRGSQAIVEALRRSDIVARWGGEELVVLLPSSRAEDAVRAIGKALVAVRALVIPSITESPLSATSSEPSASAVDRSPVGRTLAVTFSAGVVEASPRESLEEVVARADALLYAAKAAGRDRIHGPSTELIR